ncbi:hypothetical protein [Polymorphobacter sp.]|uniref:hypothetical protein n=1 Tax=Polymorphobacter sp. TaxID=1909290 RepID=UPI003F6F5C5D
MKRVALLLLLAGCTATAPETSGWIYRTSLGEAGEAERPIALFGPSETIADVILECRRDGLALVVVESDMVEGARPIRLGAGRARFAGTERLDPEDAVPTATTLVPRTDPLLAALAAGAALRVDSATGHFTLPGGAVPARVARECAAIPDKRP